jgi:hypothetical protein
LGTVGFPIREPRVPQDETPHQPDLSRWETEEF